MDTTEIKQVASEIQQRISQLTTFDGISLKEEMDSLRKVLIVNPAACELLLPEDIGLAVQALKRLVGKEIASTLASKGEKKPKASKSMTAAELKKALAEVSDDELD